MVSVIIPVYKTEAFVRECVRSVTAQSYSALEIIIIDDGSPDGAPALCDALCAEDDRIRVIHKENGGIGSARNLGMDEVRGEYVMFIDSDDMLDDTDGIEKLVKAAQKQGADITVGAYRRFSDEGREKPRVCALCDEDDSLSEAFRYKGFYSSGHLSYVWGKLYRTDFLIEHGIRSLPFRFTQDKLFNMMCYANSPVYAFIGTSVYLYRVNEKSVTFKYKEGYAEGWCEIALELERYLEETAFSRDISDLNAFHILFGSLFIAKQEKTVRTAADALRHYGGLEPAARYMSALAKGQYLSCVDSGRVKLLARLFAKLFVRGRYRLLAIAIHLIW